MRLKVANDKKAKAKTVSLYPDQWKYVENRAGKAGSRSKYFQLLAEFDRANDLLPRLLKEQLKKNLQANGQ